MATVTTRLAIDSLRSARARREQYVGEWLPERILSDSRDDPARHAEMAYSRPLAMLVLLESLSPEQRAVVLLRGVFDYGYDEIARIVGMSEDNVRQLAGQTGAHLERRRPRVHVPASREQREELSRRFFAAVEDGQLAGLEALLAHDVFLTGDGRGKIPALARPLRDRNRVARALIDWIRVGRESRAPAGAERATGADADLQRRRVAAARRALRDRDRRLQPPPARVVATRPAAAIGGRLAPAGRAG